MVIVCNCTGLFCDSYGLKAVNGVNRVSGPGLESEKSPGMMQGGGRWPLRCVWSVTTLYYISKTNFYDFILWLSGYLQSQL